MIIQNASIQLAQDSSHYHRLKTSSLMQTVSRSSFQGTSNPLVVSTNHQFNASQHQTSKFLASSRVEHNTNITDQHLMAKTAANLTSIQLSSHSAQIAIKQAFPSDSTTGVSASGKAAFQFTHQIQLQQGSHNLLSASGQVHLEDGRQIQFNLHLEHQQDIEINALSELSLQQAVMHDPLVINLGNEPVQLRNTTFEFDLMSNGKTQTYAALGQGAGYLTFDQNGDGNVTDGAELFGTRTGDAYAELAVYDDDGNGWIDKNDAIFSQLKLWLDQTDTSSTISLAEAGVGAIYLGHVPFDYALRNEQAALMGQSKAASIVLMENGSIKTSQAIDLMPLIHADTVQTVEQSADFKRLERMATTLNSWFEKINQMQQSLQSFNEPAISAGISTDTPPAAQENWFEALQKKIQQMVNERRALLEGVLGKSTTRKWGQA